MHYNNTIQTIFVSQPSNAGSFLMACHIIYLYCVYLNNMGLRMVFILLLHHTGKRSLPSFK